MEPRCGERVCTRMCGGAGTLRWVRQLQREVDLPWRPSHRPRDADSKLREGPQCLERCHLAKKKSRLSGALASELSSSGLIKGGSEG